MNSELAGVFETCAVDAETHLGRLHGPLTS